MRSAEAIETDCTGYAAPPAPDPQFLQQMAAASLLGASVQPSGAMHPKQKLWGWVARNPFMNPMMPSGPGFEFCVL